MTPNTSGHHEGHEVWIPCGTCWGQRTLFTTTGDGALAASACPSCLGVGERLSGGGHVPAPTP